MLNFFEFGNKRSTDYGILIRNKKTYDAPERNVEFISVAGKDGDIIIDSGTYKNIMLEYGVSIVAENNLYSNRNINLSKAIGDIKNWLCTRTDNYYKLTDTYDPDYYRKACFIGGLEVETYSEFFAKSRLQFNCKPYRYNIEEDAVIDITDHNSNTIIKNPESYASLPLIRLYGQGETSFTINGYTYTFDFSQIPFDNVYIDSEREYVYNNTNYSMYYTPSVIKFPKLNPGNNTISMGFYANKIEITPRWRTI